MNDIILRPPTKKELKYLKDKNISFTFTDFAKATSKYNSAYKGYMLIKGPFPQGISLLDYWYNVKRVKAIVNGSPKRVYACTRCLRSGKVTRA